MMRKFVRIISLVITLFLTLSCLGGCSKKGSSKATTRYTSSTANVKRMNSTTRPSTTIVKNTQQKNQTNVQQSTMKEQPTSKSKDGGNVEEIEVHPSAEPVNINMTDRFNFQSNWDKSYFNDSILINASNSFGLDVFRTAAAENADKNVIISPLSMFTAFSLLINGAGGDTKNQMKSAMHIDSFNDADLNTRMNNLMSYLMKYHSNGKNGFKRIYNSVWINHNVNIKDSFTEISKKYYKSDIYKVNFYNKGVINDMNNWIAERSGGLIQNVIDELDPVTLMVLFNVLHFKGKWHKDFDKSKTQIEPFYLRDGTPINVNMMNDERLMSFYEDERVQVGELKFNNDANLLIILPKIDIDEFTASINADMINTYLDNLKIARVKLKVPSFDIEYRSFMKKILKDVGMNLPFDLQNADFSGISGEGIKFCVGEVLHDCVVKVNEEGAEAAALTVIFVPAAAPPGTVPPIEDKVLYVDKPFIFAISDRSSESILFIGKVMDPRQ